MSHKIDNHIKGEQTRTTKTVIHASHGLRVKRTYAAGPSHLMGGFLDKLCDIIVVFTVSLFPFAMFMLFKPDIAAKLITYPWNLILIPYVLFMPIVGAKVSSLFHGDLWARLTKPRRRKRREW